MNLIWLFFLFELIVLTLLQPFITNYYIIGIIAVGFHTIFTSLLFLSYKSKIKYIFYLGYLLRVFLLFWDIYGRNIFILPHSGADSEMYFRNAVLISQNFSILGNTRGGIYSDILSFIVYLIGPQRITLQYINVLFGMSVLFIIFKILKRLKIKDNVILIIITLASVFPSSVIMSVVMLREIIPTFFVALSVYYFISWFRKTGLKYILLCFLSISIASMFHSGVIAILLGYLFGFILYDKEKKTFIFKLNTVGKFIIISIILIGGILLLDDFIFSKFSNIDDITDIYDTANVRMGGSRYLTSMEIDSPLDMVMYGPIRAVYFLFSPMPWDWRGINDLITFLIDSSFYFYVLFLTIKDRKFYKNSRALIICLIIMILTASFVFGIGVFTAGTAMRHRQKLTPLFLILLGIIMNKKNSKKVEFT